MKQCHSYELVGHGTRSDGNLRKLYTRRMSARGLCNLLSVFIRFVFHRWAANGLYTREGCFLEALSKYRICGCREYAFDRIDKELCGLGEYVLIGMAIEK